MKQLFIYGIVTGLLIAGYMYLAYLTDAYDYQMGKFTGLVSMVLTLLGIYFGMRAYRQYPQKNNMSYWQGVLAGVLISLFAGLITATFTFVYLQYINPGFAEYMVDLNRQNLIQKGATDRQVQSNAIVTREIFRPLPQALRALGGYVAAGSLISLVMAGFLKSRGKE